MPRWTDSLPMTNAYFLLILRAFGTTPELRAAILRGIDEEKALTAASEITLGDQIRQVRNLSRLDLPGWALEVSDRLETVAHGPVGFACVSAPTLGEGLAVMARYGRVRSPFYRLEIERRDETFTIRSIPTVELTDEELIPLMELLTRSHQSLIETLIARPMSEAVFRFAWPAPAWAGEYGSHYSGSVVFDADATEILLPASWLDMISPMADPAAFQENLRKLEALSRRLEGDDYVVAQVEQLLLASTTADIPLAQAARRLGVSGRTLVRKLRGAGVTYQGVVDDMRRERARELLGCATLSIAEVGHRLGYEDAANFGRACRRWFAMSPGQYRKSLLGTDDVEADATVAGTDR